jgi:hypothetical protein
MFYSVYGDKYWEGQGGGTMPRPPSGEFVRVLITGENVEPVMDECDFAISFSRLVDNPRHFRLPLWAYECHCWGFAPESLLKQPDTDWEKVAATKTKFCNFVYSHDVRFRNQAFTMLTQYKQVDAAGRCMNNMDGSFAPGAQAGMIEMTRPYKFNLAIEHTIWPGYATEKLVNPMFVNSIPIYLGDPLARTDFDPTSYVDFTSFRSLRTMFEFVQEIDNDRNLYIEMLVAPFYRNNKLPNYARDESILAFFDRIFAAALERRGSDLAS